MAIKAGLSDAVFTYSNASHYSGWAFPDVSSGTSFTSSVWVYLNNTTPFILWSYDGGGSYIRIEHDGTNWLLNLNGATTIINAIAVGDWTYITYNKSGNNHIVYHAPSSGSSTLKINTTVSITFSFSLFTLTASAGNAVCSFKMHNGSVNLQGGSSAWISGQSGRLWDSVLRRRGDLHANHGSWTVPFSSTSEWTSFPTWTTLSFQDDPDVLKPSDCIAYLLPIGTPVFQNTPTVVPFLSAIQESDGFFMLEDRQAVPLDAFIYVIRYQARQTHVGGLYIITSIDRWATYISDTGVPYSQKRGSWDVLGTEGAQPYNYTPPPVNGTNHPMTMTNIYDWQFGVDWIFTNGLASGPPTNYPPQMSAASTVDYPLITVTYHGGVDWPDEEDPPDPTLTYAQISQLPIEIVVGASDLSGLYTPNPPTIPTIGTPRRDLYYNRDTPGPGSIAKKIPNPTIKTGLIGE